MTRKTIAHYLTDLTTDLKITLDSELSTAELTRCVERAVADYSRFVPREMTREVTIDAEVASESFTTPAVSDPNYFVDADDISAITDGDLPGLVTAQMRPDVPRPVMITITDANLSITQFVLIVKGYDVDNVYIEEFFYLEGGLVQTGEQYFALVTEVEFDEITGVGAGDVLDVGTGDADGVYVQLANRPVKFQSESIGSLALDTDYEMDYAGGRIAMKDGGSMAVSTAYSITYTKSRITVDLATLIDDLIRVERVEYPAGQVPQTHATKEVWGNILTITGGHSSQAEMGDQEHAVIEYYASHSPPNAMSPGSYPAYLDTTIQLAASAYALFILALQYEHQAVTDFASVRTVLTGTINTATTGTHALAKVALDAAAVLVTASSGKIDVALTKVALYLETSDTTDNAKDVLANITDDVADLRTAIATAVDAMVTALGNVLTISLDKATTGAEALLDTGDDFIDNISDGKDVPENYANYAATRAAIANSRLQAASVYAQEAATRLSNLRSYIEEASGWMQMGNIFLAEAAQWVSSANIAINEATARIGEIDRYLAEARQYNDLGLNDLYLADRFKAEAIERRNEAWAIWASPNQIAPNYALGQRGQSP